MSISTIDMWSIGAVAHWFQSQVMKTQDLDDQLHRAIGDLDKSLSLIKKGAKLNKNGDDLALLSLVIEHRRLDAIPLLIKAGANVNGKTKEGETFLECAIQRDDTKMAKVLIDNGAIVDDMALFSLAIEEKPDNKPSLDILWTGALQEKFSFDNGS